MSEWKVPYLPPAEIDALRLKAFRTNSANDIEAYYKQASLYFQYRTDRELDRSYRIAELETKLAEALNQLDSARHSVDVLEKRVANLLDGYDEHRKPFVTSRTTLAELKGEK